MPKIQPTLLARVPAADCRIGVEGSHFLSTAEQFEPTAQTIRN